MTEIEEINYKLERLVAATASHSDTLQKVGQVFARMDQQFQDLMRLINSTKDVLEQHSAVLGELPEQVRQLADRDEILMKLQSDATSNRMEDMEIMSQLVSRLVLVEEQWASLGTKLRELI